MIMIEPLYHITEIEEMIGINKYSIYKKIRQYKFPSGVKLNGKRMFKQSEIKDYYSKIGVKIEFEKSN
jgi:predicted DNA-binding transcriptional regulator AlpA